MTVSLSYAMARGDTLKMDQVVEGKAWQR